MEGLRATARRAVAYATVLSLLFQFQSQAFAFSKLDPKSASDSQISRELQSNKWQRLVTSSASDSQLREVADYTASLLAELHRRRKHNSAKIETKYKNEIGSVGYLFRELGKTRKLSGPFGMSVRPELLFEWRLTEAVNNSEPPRDPCSIICSFAKKYDEWRYHTGNKEEAHFGLASINDSWSLPLYSLEAMFFAKVVKLCPGDHTADLRTALERWLNHPYVKYREHELKLEGNREGGKNDKFLQVLMASSNQYRTWGKNFSNVVLRELLRNPSLQAFLPKTLGIDSSLGGGTINVDPAYLQRTNESMEKSLTYVFSQRARLNKGVGGSNMHFHMLGTLLSAVSAKSGAAPTRALVEEMERKQGSRYSELEFPYTIDGRAPSSERSSAARAVPFRFAEFKNLGYSQKRMNRLVDALVNFAIHSGSLTIHVARNGVHLGGDGIAPYYWPPTLPVAAAGLNLALQVAKQKGDERNVKRIQWAKEVFERSITAHYNPKTAFFMNAGTGTYGANPKAWVNAFQAIGLIPACQEKQGKVTLGAYSGLMEEEFLTAMKDGEGIDPLRKLIGSGAKGGASGKGGKDQKDHTSGKGKGRVGPKKREIDRSTPAERLVLAFERAKKAGDIFKFLDQYKDAALYKEFFSDANKLKTVLNLKEDSPYWLVLRNELWPEPPPPPRKIAKPIKDTNPLFQLLSSSRFSLKTPEQLRRQLESFRQQVEMEDRNGLREALIDMLYSKRESQQEWLLEKLKTLSLDSSSDKETDGKIVEQIRNLLSAMQDRDKIKDVELKKSITARANASFRWNKNLKNAIASPTGIIAIELANGKTERMNAKDWMKNQIVEFGYDNLVRFASSVGGETGERTLALLKLAVGKTVPEALHFSTGKQGVALGSHGSKNKVTGKVRIRMSDGELPLTDQVKRYLPTDSPAWKRIKFFQPTDKSPPSIDEKNDFVLHSTEGEKDLVPMQKSVSDERRRFVEWLKRKKEAERKEKERLAKELKHNQGIKFDKRIAAYFVKFKKEIASLFPKAQLAPHNVQLERRLIHELEKALELPRNSLFDNGIQREFGRAYDNAGTVRYFFKSYLGSDEKVATIAMDDRGNYFVVENPNINGATSDSRVPFIVSKKEGGPEKGVYFFGLNGIEKGEILSDKSKGKAIDLTYKIRGKFTGKIKTNLFTDFWYPGSGEKSLFTLEGTPRGKDWFGHLAPTIGEKDLDKKMESHLRRFSKYPEIKKLIEKKDVEEIQMSLGIFEKDPRHASLKRAIEKINRKQVPIPPSPERQQKRQPPVPPKPQGKRERKLAGMGIPRIGWSKPGEGTRDRSVGKSGPATTPKRKTPVPPKKKLSSSERAKYEKWIREYENLSYGKNDPRLRYMQKHYKFGDPKAPFNDVPIGGTGKIIVAYFGPRDDPRLISQANKYPLVEVRRYPYGSPEHAHARLMGVRALVLDGLGRKIIRYHSPMEAVVDFGANPKRAEQVHRYESDKLQRYLDAKKALAEAENGFGSSGQSGKSGGSGGGSGAGSGSGTGQGGTHKKADPHQLASATKRCASCHARHDSRRSRKRFSPEMKTAQGLQNHLKFMSKSLLGDMIGRANLSPKEKEAVLTHAADKQVPPRRKPKRRSEIKSQMPTCYQSKEKNTRDIQALPDNLATSSIGEALQKAKSKGKMLFYDKKSVPVTWQGDTIGAHGDKSSVVYARLMNPKRRVNGSFVHQTGYPMDGGTDYPWLNTAGYHLKMSNASTSKFIVPPPGGGPFAKMRLRSYAKDGKRHFSDSNNMWGKKIGWNFVPGTLVGEVLKVGGIPFEVRVRQKQNDGSWKMDVLRPFRNGKDLAAGIRSLCSRSTAPKGCSAISSSTLDQIENPTLKNRKRTYYLNADNFKTGKFSPLQLNAEAPNGILSSANSVELPSLPKDVAALLLKETPFQSVMGIQWAKDSWAPTTSSSKSNIVPQGYFASHLAMTQKNCMTCHASAGLHVESFNPTKKQMYAPWADDLPRPRTWYGSIRGNDGILSWHPFSRSAIESGALAAPSSVDRCLTRNGLVSNL